MKQQSIHKLESSNINVGSFLLGRKLGKKDSTLGFAGSGRQKVQSSELILDDGEIHNLTIGKSGSGKGRYSLITNLLTNPCSAVVMDVKGELAKTTARQRLIMGHDIHFLDPFKLMHSGSSSLNPFDSRYLNKDQDIMTYAQGLADSFCEKTSLRDHAWDNSASLLVAALICYIYTALPKEEQNMETLVKLLFQDDIIYNLAVILDTQKDKMHPSAYQGMSYFLQTTEVTRSGILFTAQNYFRAFNNPQILGTMKNSIIDLAKFVKDEKPMTIYIIIPPAYIQSHFTLIKVWFNTLLKALTERREVPERQTVFYMDEIAQFGHFELLENVMTIGRGYGIKVWLYLQGIQQLQGNYEKNWRTMLGNCGVLQLFGVNNKLTADEISNLTGIAASELLGLNDDEQYLVRQGIPEKALKLDYLKDEMFAGKFDANPYYRRKQNLYTTQRLG